MTEEPLFKSGLIHFDPDPCICCGKAIKVRGGEAFVVLGLGNAAEAEPGIYCGECASAVGAFGDGNNGDT
jgi:hypothetical protein